MARHHGGLSRPMQAFEALLEEDEPAVQKGPKSKGQGKKGRGDVTVPRFKLRQSSAGETSGGQKGAPADLHSMFGGTVDSSVIQEVYAACGCSMEAAVDALLSMGMSAMDVAAAASSSSQRSEDVPDSSEAQDACYWEWLPVECQQQILSQLSLRELSRAAATSHAFAEHVRAVRAALRTLIIPPGLSHRAVRGMVAAHVGAQSVILTRCAHQLRFSHHFEDMLEAVAKGEGSRKGGQPVQVLSLKGCGRIVDADITYLCGLFEHLRELNLTRCEELTDAAMTTLARYRSSIGAAEDVSGSSNPQPSAAAARFEAAYGNVPSSEEDGFDEELPLQAAERSRPQVPDGAPRAYIEAVSGGPRASATAPTAPARHSGSGGLRRLTLAGCTKLGNKGLQALLQGPVSGSSLEFLDVSHCPELTGAGLALRGKGPLQLLKAAGCRGIRSVTLQLPHDHPLERLVLPACTSLTEVTISATHLLELNLSQCASLTSLSLQCGKLRHLALAQCRQLRGLGGDAFQCPALQTLNVFGCHKLESEGLEEALRGCLGLRRLTLAGCLGVGRLLMGQHLALEAVDAAGCGLLRQVLLGSPLLTSLTATGCSRLVEVRLHSHRLAHLDLRNCSGLRSLQLVAAEAAPAPTQDGTRQGLVALLEGCTLPPAQLDLLRKLTRS